MVTDSNKMGHELVKCTLTASNPFHADYGLRKKQYIGKSVDTAYVQERKRSDIFFETNNQGIPAWDRTPAPNHKFITMYCTGCGRRVVINLNCGDRTCQYCRRKWYGKHYGNLVGVVRGWETVRTVVLTVRNIPEGKFRKNSVQRMRDCFERLRHRKRWRQAVRGGFYFVQATNRRNDWHLHIHVIYRGVFLPQAWLREAWREITGDSFVVDIRARSGPGAAEAAVRYLLSDSLGEPVVQDEDKDRYNEVFHGARLLQGFGEYGHWKPEKSPMVCPDCGCTEWSLPTFDGEYQQWKDKGCWPRGSPGDGA